MPTAPTPIDALPTPPSTNDPMNFDARGDAFFAAQVNFRAQANALATNAYNNAVEADADAAAAALSKTDTAALKLDVINLKADTTALKGVAVQAAADALNYKTQAEAAAGAAAGFKATSATSLMIGLGSKTLTVEAGKTFSVTDWLQIASAADGTKFMVGQVTAWDASTGALTVNVVNKAGAGTFAAWNVGLTGAPGTSLTAGTLGDALNFAPTVPLTVAAGAVDLAGAASNNVSIGGVGNLSALGTLPEGAVRFVTFNSALTLVHGASLNLPAAANFTTAAGDTALVKSLGAGAWKVISYAKADGTPITAPFQPGDLLLTARATAPAGFLKADGSSYLASAYPALAPLMPPLLNFTTPTSRTNPAGSANINDAAYGAGRWVMSVANFVTGFQTSTDAINWTGVANPFNSDGIYPTNLAFGAGLFVAMAQQGIAAFATSPDGLVWTRRAFPVSSGAQFLSYQGGYFWCYRGSTDGWYRSVDGFTWTSFTFPSNNILSIAYGNGRYVGVGANEAVVSLDGTNFLTSRPSSSLPAAVNKVIFGNGVFVAGTYSSATATALVSTNGVDWDACLSAGGLCREIAFSQGQFILASTSAPHTIYSSPDGQAWAARGNVGSQLNRVVGANGLFLFIATNAYWTGYAPATPAQFVVPNMLPTTPAPLTPYIKA